MDKNSTPLMARGYAEVPVNENIDVNVQPSRLTLMRLRQFARVYNPLSTRCPFGGIILN